MNILHHHYYVEAHYPLHMKMRKLKSSSRPRPKLCPTPEPLKVEKFKLFENPLKRTRTAARHEKPTTSQLKYREPCPLFSESFNNYLENHALTTLSPVELINHYIISSDSRHKAPVHKVHKEKQGPIDFPVPQITQNISISDFKKLDEELFSKSKHKVKPIIKFTKRLENNLKVIGNTLCMSVNRNHGIFKSQERQKTSRRFKRLKDVRLKSPVVQLNTAESYESLNKSLNI